jgi:hypothetical protein
MSLLQSKRKSVKKRGIFAAVTGQRLSGKSTLAGTLSGKTAMLTARMFETGSTSAESLATRLGGTLDVFEFSSAKELIAMAKEASETYDNIYIDGASGLTEILYRTPEIAKAIDKNSWDGFAKLGDAVEDVLLSIKELAETDDGPNVFVTAALEAKYDAAGSIIELAIEAKGKSVIKNLRKIFPIVLCLRPSYDADGQVLDVPELVTKTDGPFGARIDSLLADENPGVMPADLSDLINLIKGA